MTAIEKNKQAIMRCIELFNECTLEWVDTCFSRKLEWIELPSASSPQGRKGDFAFYRRIREQGLRAFPDRKLKVLNIVAERDCVVLDQEWQGTLAVTVGNHPAGTVSKLRLASFFTLENGLITKQIDYCVPAI